MRSPTRTPLIAMAALVTAVALHRAGSGPLATPPLRSWDALDAWYVHRGPAVAVVAVVRLVALAASWWLVAAGGLQLLAGAVGRDGFSRVVDAVSPRLVRALSTGAAGLSLSAGLTMPASAADDPPGTAVMVPLDVPATVSSTTTVPSTTTTSVEPLSTSSTERPPSPTTTTLSEATTTTVVTRPPELAAPAVPVVPAAADELVVTRGDSFWAIAVEEAGTRDVVRYWRALIEANRDRLLDPSNPDLIYPGQALRLP